MALLAGGRDAVDVFSLGHSIVRDFFPSADYQMTVCSIQAYSDRAKVYLRPCGTWVSKNNCPSDHYLAWKITPKGNGEVMYSTAMAAMLSDKKVTLRLNGSSCTRNYDSNLMIRILK